MFVSVFFLLKFQGGKHTQSKGGILAKACEYLADLRSVLVIYTNILPVANFSLSSNYRMRVPVK
jgi:hypothetical protein